MPKELNALMVGELEVALKGVAGGIAVDYQRTDAKALSAIRAKLRAQNVRFRVVKNRLAGIALKSSGAAAAASLVKGPTALAFGDEEQTIAAARVLTELKKEYPGINLNGFFLAGQAQAGEAPVAALAKSPGRRELLGMMAQVVNAPGTQMATVFQATINQVAYAFQALADKLAAGGSA